MISAKEARRVQRIHKINSFLLQVAGVIQAILIGLILCSPVIFVALCRQGVFKC